MTDAAPTLWRRLRYSRLRDVVRGRLDSSLDWRNAVGLAELPPELADAVRQVVGRTRLWRREKLDVATELVCHFQDGLEAGRLPDELLKSFGDPQAAAQLIGRAKRRGRSPLWKLARYGWMSAAALLFVYIVAGIWMAAGRPTVKTDYLAIMNKPSLEVPEDERAWPRIRDALLATGINTKDNIYTEVVTNDARPKPNNERSGELEQLIAAHPDAIAKLREAARMPHLAFVTATFHADFPQKDRDLFGVKVTPEDVEAARHATLNDRWLISTLLPHMQYLRISGELLATDAQRAAAAGERDVAFADVLALFGVSRHCEETPFMVNVLVAELVQRMARRVIQDTLTAHPELWKESQLRDMAHEIVGSRVDWRRGFDGERMCIYDSMQRIYTDNGHGDGRLALHVSGNRNLFQLLNEATGGRPTDSTILGNEAVAFMTMPAANLAVASRQETIDMYDRVTDRALARMGTPYWTWADEPSLDEQMKAITEGPINRFRYMFVSMLTPSYDRLLNRLTVSDGERQGALIGLALELYHRDEKRWPQSLAELSPRWLPEAPVDPLTGKPLHYKIVDDRPLVYSVGIDGDDDGGRLAKNKDGESHPEYAEPNYHSDRKDLGDSEKDGDWVLWTTAKSD